MTRLTSLCLAYQPRDHKGAEALDLVGSLGRYRHAGRCIPGIFFDLSSTATNEKCLQPSGPLLWQSRGSGPWTETGTLPILIPLRCLGAGNARKLVATISCASGNHTPYLLRRGGLSPICLVDSDFASSRVKKKQYIYICINLYSFL